MRISKKAEYALRAMLAMCRSAAGTTFSIQMLANDEKIPLKFLEQILLLLRKGGILYSKRGAGGGYQLARQANQIPVAEILHLIDGPLEILPQLPGDSRSVLHLAFEELQDEVTAWLKNTTMADILQKEIADDAMNFEI